MLDGDEPEIRLDYNNPGENGWSKQGDVKAITFTCDSPVQDDGPGPNVATSTAEATSSAVA